MQRHSLIEFGLQCCLSRILCLWLGITNFRHSYFSELRSNDRSDGCSAICHRWRIQLCRYCELSISALAQIVLEVCCKAWYSARSHFQNSGDAPNGDVGSFVVRTDKDVAGSIPKQS